MRDYIVLRDLQAARTHEPLGGGAGPRMRGGPRMAPVVPEPRIEVESLATKDVRDIARDPEVVAIAPVMPTKLIEPRQEEGVAAAEGDAWGVAAVGADVSTFTGADVVVAVLDTGIDASHEAFNDVTLVQNDFSGSGNGDVQGHGSHCAGTVFGRDVDGVRIGIARGVNKALIGKVLGDEGTGDSDMIFRGIRWAVDEGANVISMSLGFDFPGMVKRLVEGGGWPADLATSAALEAYRANLRMFDVLMDLVRAGEAFGPGTVVVAAAGNESERQIDPDYEIGAGLPAAADGVIAVGALGQAGNELVIADFSNTFPQIAAPGVAVKSVRVGGGTRDLNGTSMACPHVAGVAALWWEAVRQSPVPATARTVVAKLLASARTDVLSAKVNIADRGVGIVTAP